MGAPPQAQVRLIAELCSIPILELLSNWSVAVGGCRAVPSRSDSPQLPPSRTSAAPHSHTQGSRGRADYRPTASAPRLPLPRPPSAAMPTNTAEGWSAHLCEAQTVSLTAGRQRGHGRALVPHPAHRNQMRQLSEPIMLRNASARLLVKRLTCQLHLDPSRVRSKQEDS